MCWGSINLLSSLKKMISTAVSISSHRASITEQDSSDRKLAGCVSVGMTVMETLHFGSNWIKHVECEHADSRWKIHPRHGSCQVVNSSLWPSTGLFSPRGTDDTFACCQWRKCPACAWCHQHNVSVNESVALRGDLWKTLQHGGNRRWEC